MTDVLQAIVLGIVQGLTEFIPVSSSAHLIIVPWLLEPVTGVRSFGLSFDIALHLGTMVAVVGYFWNDWLRYLRALVMSVRERRIGGHHDRLLAWLLILGSIPGALAGAVGEDAIDSFFHTADSPHAPVAMTVMALLIIALAAALWLAERLAHHVRRLESIGPRDALIVGLAQALALLPGVSRSGSTITAGLALGLRRDAAARFSFLLGTPIIAGGGAKALLDGIQGGALASNASVFVAGFLAAGIVGYVCIKYLLRYLQTHSTLIFVYYRVALGVLLLVLVLAGYGR